MAFYFFLPKCNHIVRPISTTLVYNASIYRSLNVTNDVKVPRPSSRDPGPSFIIKTADVMLSVLSTLKITAVVIFDIYFSYLADKILKVMPLAF